ncbi:MAG: FAD-dependent oxidoreductase [Thermodesulfobacteriota bacterium]|nr:FAD-dependent oxidoreductase [Thermodesulfobacteriota bacterium]
MVLCNLFKPITISGVEIRNRIVMAPMGSGLGAPDGTVTKKMLDYYVERSRGGAGLITVETTCVDLPLGKVGPWQLVIDGDEFMDGLRNLAEAIKREGAKVSLQLAHAGRYAISSVIGAQPVAPSTIISRYTREPPRELTTEEVEMIIEKFGDGAQRAQEAGFDGVELMGCTGYLISQFTSPITNKRTDRFGGDVEGRATFAVDIIKNIRKKVGDNFIVSFKHSVDEYMPHGTTISDSKILAKKVEDAGASIFHAWAGWHESPIPMLPMSVKRGAFIHLAEAMKEVITIPVIGVGRINDPRLADQIIKEGRADLIAMGRAFLADPHFPQKAAEGRFEEIRMCIGCCKCFDNLMLGRGQVVCAINAELCREGEQSMKPAQTPKKIIILGGGPAGMEAARVAALRGHKVTLWEERERLGGNMFLASIAPHKEEIQNITAYLTHQLEKLGVTYSLHTKATKEMILKENPDEIIVATGATPIIPPIPGADSDEVVSAIDVLEGTVNVGETIAIVGGGMIGCEVAEFLAHKGKKVTLVETQAKIALDIGPTTGWVVRRRIKDIGVRILTSATVQSIQPDGITVEKEGKIENIYTHTVILAVGMEPHKELAKELAHEVQKTHYIGDCAKANTIMEAIHDGFHIGCEI